jgi:hypothetical protein
MAYTVGRFWIEAMRTDEAHVILGMRVNNWVSIVVFLGALLYFLRVRGPQEHIQLREDGPPLLVTADGTPIEGRDGGSRPAADGDGDPPPGHAGPDDAGLGAWPGPGARSGPEEEAEDRAAGRTEGSAADRTEDGVADRTVDTAQNRADDGTSDADGAEARPPDPAGAEKP